MTLPWLRARFAVIAAALLAFGLLSQPAGAAVRPDAVAYPGGAVAVLGAPAFLSWNSDVEAKLEGTGLFRRVRVFNVRAGRPLPDLPTLSRFRAVLVFSDQPVDGGPLGDLLADYVDGGGGLVVATFAFYYPANPLAVSGRIVSGGYLPFTTVTGNQSSVIERTLVPVAARSPLLCGVASFSGGSSSYFNTNLTLAAGARMIARWSGSGRPPLLALRVSPANPNRKIVGLNAFPPSSDARDDLWRTGTDGARLMANALVAAGGRTTCQPS